MPGLTAALACRLTLAAAPSAAEGVTGPRLMPATGALSMLAPVTRLSRSLAVRVTLPAWPC